jgi:hypothetical protein
MSVAKLLKHEAVMWAALGVGAYVAVVYLLPRLTKKLAAAPADTVNAINQGLGNNALTQDQTDFAGDSVDYSGHGIFSTLGAAVNGFFGGVPASIGEKIGDALSPSYDPNAATGPAASAATRSQVVTPNYVTDLQDISPGWN